MQHVFDHYDYTRDLAWLRDTGYPLLRSVAAFWVSQLQEDLFTRDGTLVVNPCNSPEQGPTTFGCAHYQQLIRQVFEAVLITAPLVPDADDDDLDGQNHGLNLTNNNNTTLTTAVADALARLDAGAHIDAATGVLREWKVPDDRLYDVYPQHRHLSHLVGWYPGHALAGGSSSNNNENNNYGYANATLQAAVRASLVARGDGTDADGDGGDYGWPKAWRAACWARLNDSARAHGELALAVAHNVAPNLLSMYSAGAGGGGAVKKNPPFQVDLNLGWAGAVLSMLVVDLPLAPRVGGGGGPGASSRTVVLGPAIPGAWGGGSVKGLRIRGGGVVDFEWDGNGLVTRKTVVSGDVDGVRFVNVDGDEL